MYCECYRQRARQCDGSRNRAREDSNPQPSDPKSDDTIGNKGLTKNDSASDSNQATEPLEGGELDPELAAIVDAWPTLPEPLRAGIVAMVKCALSKHEEDAR